MEAKNLVGGLLAAAAIGVAIGILLAPASGAETLDNLAKGSRKFKDKFLGTVEDSFGSLKERFNSGVDELAKKGRDTINSTSDKIKVS